MKKQSDFVLLISVLPFLFMPGFSGASTAPKPEILEAKKIIAEYRKSRSSCIKSMEDERIECFHALEKQRDKYNAAKHLINETMKNRKENIHFVSFL